MSEAEEMELFKKEFYEDLSKITNHRTVSNAAVNISEEAFKAMKDDPQYREKVLSLIQRDWGDSYAPRNCSVLITVGATLNEYRADSWPVGYDSEFDMRSQNSFYKRTSEKKDRQKELLEEYLEKKEIMGEDEAVSMIIQLCRILKQLHRCRSPIIHRDLKPANIMISSDGVVKLIDFNAAKEYRMGQMEDTCLMGTREYAAPEQYGFGQSDARTDIYALGVILNRLLTGDFPKNKLYEGRLKPVIQTCIQMDADARYQSVELLERALESGKNEKQRKKNTGKRMVLHLKKRYLPVGFRTGKVWKMFAAGFGYWLITYCCLTMNFHDRSGAVQMGYALWLNRIVVWIYMIFSVFFVGNYVGLRRKFPGMKGKLWGQFLFGCGYLVLFFCVAAVVVGLLE